MNISALRVPFLDLKAECAGIREEINQALRQVVDSAHFVGGEWVEKFEQAFADYVGAKYDVGVSSGTSALELALKAAGIGSGHEVVVPANTFFATAEAVSNVGATPVFADVNAATFHLDVASVERAITPRTRAVIPVHLYGRAMDLRPLERLALRYDFTLIEDAAQAHGASLNGARVGSSGRLTCFSFYPGKNLGAYGDAGAVTTNDGEQARALRLLREHGSAVKYEHVMVGTNARLDSLQAAVLAVKLPHLDRWNAGRRRHAHAYAAALGGSSIVPPEIPGDGRHVFHLFVVRTRERAQLREFLQARNIDTGIHYPVPLHLTPAYQAMGYPGRGSFPVAEKLATEILSLPMYAALSEEQIRATAGALLEFAAVAPCAVEVAA